MLSSDLVEESSLQLLLKHQTRMMTLYYGRNHAKLVLSAETRRLFLKTMYEEVGRDLYGHRRSKLEARHGARDGHPNRAHRPRLALFIEQSEANGNRGPWQSAVPRDLE